MVGQRQKKLSLFNVLLTLFFIILAVVTIFPFWNILMVSIAPNEYYVKSGVVLFPTSFTFRNYEYIFTSSQVLLATLNSIIVSVLGVIYGMALTVPLAYGLSKGAFPGKKLLITYVLIPMFFGGGLIPFYLVVKNLGLIEHLAALIIPYGINLFYLIVIKNSFTSIPKALLESAQIDGANDFVVLFRIVLPLSMATIATFGLFMTVDKWNDWFSSLLFLTDGRMYPLAKLLRDIIYNNVNVGDPSLINPGLSGEQLYAGMDGIKMATVVIAILPILCVYPFLQRYFVKGVTVGGVKG